MPMEMNNKNDPKYGIPQLKKFPMPDADHVRSAIRFFNYVTPKYEKQLASAILRRMKEYGLTFDDISVGDKNMFSKYIPKRDYLAHHGILGMKWGIHRFQPYPKGYSGDGKFTGNRFTPERMNKEQNLVLDLSEKGMSIKEISKKTGINQDAVNDYLMGGFGPRKVDKERAKLDKWREKEIANVNKRYDDKLNETETELAEKSKLYNSKENIDRVYKTLESYDQHSDLIMLERAVADLKHNRETELNRIMRMSMKDVNKEKIEVIK